MKKKSRKEGKKEQKKHKNKERNTIQEIEENFMTFHVEKKRNKFQFSNYSF